MRTMSIPQVTAAPTPMSQGCRRASTLPSFGIRKKSEIDIILDGKDEFIRSYTTFDEIKGHVNLRFERDTPIDSLNITFQGQANTWVEKMTSITPRAGRATAKHVFLRMQQPIDANLFSEENVAKAGVIYNIPFTFVVPEKVLPFVCSHTVDDESVKDQHCYLPPSIGESMLAGERSILMDDLCPAMAKIVYSIKANLTVAASKGHSKDSINQSVGIRIIPARPSPSLPAPELNSKEGCFKYNFRKEKDVRKGILKFGKKQGRLMAETSSPQSLKLPSVRDAGSEAVSTTATINLRYDPASLNEAPPQLTGIASRLKAFTFFGAAPFKHLVDPTNYDIWSIVHSHYSLTVDLSELNLTAVKWTKHDIESPFAERVRHGSIATTASSQKMTGQRKMSTSTGTASTDDAADHPGISRTLSDLSDLSDNSYSPASSTTTLSVPGSPSTTNDTTTSPIVSPSVKYDQTLPYYTASIIVPITLPSAQNSSPEPSDSTPRRSSLGTESATNSTFTRKRGTPTFLPTFHSCLIARTYVLELAVHAAPAPQLNLRVPIQIVSEPVQRTQAPMSWYDPFDLNVGARDEDTANDEAIARALNPQYSTDEQIPSYADLQILTQNVASYRTSDEANFPRHNSLPLNSLFPSNSYAPDDHPPEYNAPVGFRRRQSTPLVQAQTRTRTEDPPVPSNRRRESSGWTKKLGLRS